MHRFIDIRGFYYFPTNVINKENNREQKKKNPIDTRYNIGCCSIKKHITRKKDEEEGSKDGKWEIDEESGSSECHRNNDCRQSKDKKNVCNIGTYHISKCYIIMTVPSREEWDNEFWRGCSNRNNGKSYYHFWDSKFACYVHGSINEHIGSISKDTESSQYEWECRKKFHRNQKMLATV